MADDQASGEMSLLDKIRSILLPEDCEYDMVELVNGSGVVLVTYKIPRGAEWKVDFTSLPLNLQS